MKWFKHDTDASNDAKIKKLIIKHGAEGYAVYFHCLELIGSRVDINNVTFELEHDSEIIADNLKIKSEPGESSIDKVNRIMKTIINQGLFEKSGNKIICLKLAKRLDQSMTSNPVMRKIIEKIKNHDSVMTNHDSVMTNHDSVMTNHDSVMQDKTRLDKTILDKNRTDKNRTDKNSKQNAGFKKARQPENDNLKELKKNVSGFFREKSPQHFLCSSDYAKENKFVKELCLKAQEINPDFEDQKAWLKSILQTFHLICTGKTGKKTFDFLKNTPYIPSRLMSKGIWPYILQGMETIHKTINLDEVEDLP